MSSFVHAIGTAIETQSLRAAYARALAELDAYPRDDPHVQLRRASLTHALASATDDERLLGQALAAYERAWRAQALPADTARFLPELIEDCRAQLASAMRRQRR